MKIRVTIFLIAVIYFITACTKGGKLDSSNGDTYTVTSTANSKQLIPIIDTTATGTFSGYYDEQLNMLTYTVTWNDLWRDTKKDTITSISFYGSASASSNGTLVRSLPFVNTNRIGSINLGLAGNTGFTATEKKDFLAGSFYFTVNTKRYPSGIIRGPLAVAKR